MTIAVDDRKAEIFCGKCASEHHRNISAGLEHSQAIDFVCLRAAESQVIIDRQLATIPKGAIRAQARYGVRRALAYAAAGDIDHACRLTTDLLDDLMRVRSATIATDLRGLARTLGRHPKNPAVRDLSPRLGTALRAAIR